MSIISEDMLKNELPDDANNSNGEILNAANRSTAFCNTWAKKYLPFENYNTTTDEPRAPYDVVQICIEVAKAMYYTAIGEVSRVGEEKAFWKEIINQYKEDLQTITIEPTWVTQTISLNTDDSMLIGTTDGGAGYTQAIPFNAYITGGSEEWIINDDWQISKGGRNDGEHPQAWYLYCDTSSIDGTLNYMRTYRKDFWDYASYK